MAHNILMRVTAGSIHRIDINFHIDTNDLDTFLGRKAHIEFLDNNVVQRLIFYRYGKFFTQ